MFKPLSKVFMTLVILIAFVGQASAYSFMPSFETSSTHSAQSSNSIDSVSNLSSSSNSDAEDDCCEVDCCESECICPANACAAFIFVSSLGYSQPMMRFTESIVNSHLNMPNNIVESLYRPPIFTS
ncbi:hypothetical protein [Pseudoalteromonas phenolica]|uniref:hypothetical protein n=1 Tax=Pseudoalteromonas phenolica TaxID=161398 RepID=UPI00110BA537|nr:hypothetical protein [Pseudoalteromonas phenolica]TMO58296.1 hypothetical protein CWC21_01035 [Pseudoalteromonas phenolica]